MVDPISSALLTALGATFSALHQWGVERAADRITDWGRERVLGDPARVLPQITRELAELRRAEFGGLPENEWAAVQIAVAESLRAADFGELLETSPRVLVSVNRLRAHVRTAGRPVLRSAALGESGRAAYHRLLRHSCHQIAKQARALDTVMRSLHAETAEGVDELKHRLDDLAREPEGRAAEFERAYVRYVADDHAKFELFQVSMGRAPALHAFEQFYRAPSLARRHPADGTELTGAGTDSANAIGSARRVVLLGGAGAGKTTFLHWLAHTAAASVRDGRDGPWRDDIPFFLSLRQFTDRPLPDPEDLVTVTARPLAGEKPDHWVSSVLRSGRAMILVDGVDELLLERREEIRRWVAGLVRAYPNARYVISTRPSAVPDEWPGAGFARFELLPLSSNGLRDLIRHWYQAARELEPDPEQRAWLGDCERRLAQSLATRPDVRSLVSSPLLCSLLCALYRKEDMYLPQSRKELLDKALELLLGPWDSRRGIAVEDGLEMSANEKMILLERFAAPMVRNAELLIAPETAAQRFGRAMSGLRSEARELAPEQVLRHMLERTGLLRERDGRIQFVHRTFRDFLAAGEFVKAGELGYLIEHAHDDSLIEVVFMAAAQARAREAGELLGRLLERARRRVTRKDRETADRLELLAAASLGYVDVIDPEHVRTDVLGAVRRLIPPGTFHDAELLARAGGFVVDLLPGPIEVGKYADETGADRAEVTARVLRTLALIGGEEAWEKIQAFGDTDRGVVIDELLRAWRQFDHSESYARTLLSNVDFGERVLEVHRWDSLTRLRYLRKLTAVQLVGDLALTDREGRRPLAEIPRLRHLEIRANEVAEDLSGLGGCAALRVLWISGYSRLRDLSALAGLGVEELRLHTTGGFGELRVPQLATLAGAPLRLLSVRHPALERGLGVLPADLPLTELVLDGRAEYRSLQGIERFTGLEKVTVHGVPSVEEVRLLGELPALKRLVVHGAAPAADLVRLRPLTGVAAELRDVTDRSAARKALPNAEISRTSVV
ncbi:NACHT domain-containing protein [Amycolatopsis alkalitolerans]|uniref:NACHT domain-containing protein n=1 Tax=Amycolatopsis alkalitolerans TaxID=2547244 RepID=A0A5C4LR34_9PSEU|nr:NACHT domain-containing protein [Amycolatopsis alkalitolerans]TNC20680.1 NACHT domain-containing protein [Amycolatopsis alkalitolerans]